MIREISRKNRGDSPRFRPLNDDEDERGFRTVVRMDEVLTEAADNFGVSRFWLMLEQAAFEVFANIQKHYEQQDRRSMGRLIEILESWVSKYCAGDLVISMVFLARGMLVAESSIQQAARFIRKAKYVIEDSPNNYFLSRVLLVEGDIYMHYDTKRAVSCYESCVEFCEKNAIYFSSEESADILESMKSSLLVSYYKLAMIERANDDSHVVILKYLNEAAQQAADLFGQNSQMARRIKERCIQETMRGRQEEAMMIQAHHHHSNQPTTPQMHRAEVIAEKQMTVQDNGTNKTACAVLTFEQATKMFEITLSIEDEGRKQRWYSSLNVDCTLERLRKLGTVTLGWFEFKDGKIIIKEDEIKKSTKMESVNKFKSVVAMIQKGYPKKSRRALSTKQEDNAVQEV